MTHIYKFAVYVAGMTPAALKATENLKRIFQDPGFDFAFEVKVVDILESPEEAERARILATPTVVRHHPPPSHRVVGDLSDRDQAILGLALGPGR